MTYPFIGGIEINQAINNPALPIGPTLVDSILINTGLINWFQAEPSYLEFSGDDISAFIDRKTGMSRLVRKGVNNGATLISKVLNGFPVAQFNADESDVSIFEGSTLDLTKPFSWAGVACLKSNPASSVLMGTFTSQTVRSILISSANSSSIKFQYGTTTTNEIPITVGVPFTFAAGYDGKYVFLRVNGVTTAAVAAGVPSSSPLSVGALPGGSLFWDGYVSDVFICNVALNSESGATLLSSIQGFIHDIYRLTL